MGRITETVIGVTYSLCCQRKKKYISMAVGKRC